MVQQRQREAGDIFPASVYKLFAAGSEMGHITTKQATTLRKLLGRVGLVLNGAGFNFNVK